MKTLLTSRCINQRGAGHKGTTSRHYKDPPDLAYTVFNGCKYDPVNIDECYAAYNAAVYLADSADCSPEGKAIKRRFKRLVEHSKEEYITEEINAEK